VSVLTLSTC